MADSIAKNLEVIDRFTYEFRRLNGDVSIAATIGKDTEDDGELAVLLKLVTLLEIVGSPLRYPHQAFHDQKPNDN